jgi:diaminohydroxyphosphoribosylaminopyrimidine deaminase / 5-amino-6-(5-phosphoribosylamino)uracil reductase
MIDLSRERPRVTLKVATSLDGAIATHSGHSQWITGPESRAQVHDMRAKHDCVLTGIGTILADDPVLTARAIPLPQIQPLRAVLDSKARTPAAAKLLETCDWGEVCLFHDHVHPNDTAGVHRHHVDRNPDHGGLNLSQVLMVLQEEYGIASVMVEAGARVAGAFLRAGLVDRLVWFRAPIIIGGDGLSVFAPLGVADLSQALAFNRLDIRPCGKDVMETYAIKRKD